MGSAEVWCAAALSGDRGLQDIFRGIINDPENFPDYHSAMAHQLFNLDCKPTEVAKLYPEFRQASKAINFAINV